MDHQAPKFQPWTLAEAVDQTTTLNGSQRDDRAFRNHATAGRLVLQGRVDGRAPEILTDNDINNDWRIDYDRSRLALIGDVRSQIHDVRVYPVLHAPDVVKRLSGMPMKNAFWDFVLGDPEVQHLSVPAIAAHHDLERVTKRGHSFYGDYDKWPFDFWHGDLAGGRADSMFSLQHDWWHPEKTQPFSNAICMRWRAMLDLLESGQLVAIGDPAAPGPQRPVSGSIWSHSDYRFVPSDGDLYVHYDSIDGSVSCFIVNMRALTLRTPAAIGALSSPSSAANSGAWIVKDDEQLTSGEVSILRALRVMFPEDIGAIDTKTRDARIQSYQKGREDLKVTSRSTIKRCLPKLEFRRDT